MNINDGKQLVQLALEARSKAYAPYSNFKVGAALLTKSGKVFQGANIENAAYGPSNCGERTAFFRAIFEGERDFVAIAVCGGSDGAEADYCYPCGICRQVMREFCDPEKFVIYVVKDEFHYREYLLKDLLPHGFGPEALQH